MRATFDRTFFIYVPAFFLGCRLLNLYDKSMANCDLSQNTNMTEFGLNWIEVVGMYNDSTCALFFLPKNVESV
jgi:hypothetical protein